MMNLLSLRNKIIAGIALVLAVVVFGWCEHRSGAAAGALNQKIVAAGDKVTEKKLAAVIVDKVAQVEVKKSVAQRADYRVARSKVDVQGDSVFADGERIQSRSIADLVKAADKVVVQDSTTIVKQVENTAGRDSVIAALDSHVDLLKEDKQPRFGVRTGVVVGAVGTVVVVVIAVKIIKAVAHR
jgi:hypothetical protein